MFKFKLLFITLFAVVEVCPSAIVCEQKIVPVAPPPNLQQKPRNHCDGKIPPGPKPPSNNQPSPKPTPLLVGLTPSEWCQCRHLPIAQQIPVLGQVSQAELSAGLQLVHDDEPDLTTPKSAAVCRKIEDFLNKTFKK